MLTILKQIFSWTVSISVGVVVALLLSIYVIQPTKVIGKSMEPTLKPNEQIMISKLPNVLNYTPKYGDVVIVDSRINYTRSFKDDLLDNGLIRLVTGNHNENIWIKRVIGKPGDVIDMKDNQIIRNGSPLNEAYINENMNPVVDKRSQINFPYVVPDESVFVLGDNRNHSKDSRYIGAVPINHVLGVTMFAK